MSYFSNALDDALSDAGMSQRSLAKIAGLSQGSISKLKSGTLEADKTQLENIVLAFGGHKQLQVNLVIARCRDLIPDDYSELLDRATLSVSEDTPIYGRTKNKWDTAVESIRKKGVYNEELRNTILFLSEIAN